MLGLWITCLTMSELLGPNHPVPHTIFSRRKRSGNQCRARVQSELPFDVSDHGQRQRRCVRRAVDRNRKTFLRITTRVGTRRVQGSYSGWSARRCARPAPLVARALGLEDRSWALARRAPGHRGCPAVDGPRPRTARSPANDTVGRHSLTSGAVRDSTGSTTGAHPHTLGVPPPPHVSGSVQMPQFTEEPQPSGTVPQS